MIPLLPHQRSLGDLSPDDPRIGREVVDSLFLVTTSFDVPDWVALSGRMSQDQADAITSLSDGVGEAGGRFEGYFASLAFWLDSRHVLVAINAKRDNLPAAASFAEAAAKALAAIPGVVSARKISGSDFYSWVVQGLPVGTGTGASDGNDGLGPDGSGTGERSDASPTPAGIPSWAWAVAGGAIVVGFLFSSRKRGA
jgi:hypothetical protein